MSFAPLIRTRAQEVQLRLLSSCPVRTHIRQPPPEPKPRPRQAESDRRRELVLQWRSEHPPVRKREIAARLGVTSTTVQNHMKALRKLGKLP